MTQHSSWLRLPIVAETPADHSAIEALVAQAFGPDRFQKTVYKFRDGVPHLPDLAFVVRDAGQVLGSLRFWPIEIAQRWPAILLGPLAVDPALRGRGIGKALMRHGLDAAAAQGHRICVLVGDRPYYEPFGFHSAVAQGLELPGWVDPDRFLVQALQPGALDGVRGMVGRAKA